MLFETVPKLKLGLNFGQNTVLCKSNANEPRQNSANFAEKNLNFSFKRNIGESLLIFGTFIVQVLAKFDEGRGISLA